MGATLIESESNERRGPNGPLRRSLALAAWLGFAALLGTATCAPAQESEAAAATNPDAVAPANGGGASIRGVVTSTDGAVYEGAHVELALSHVEDPTETTQKTDSEGAFNFAGLSAGTFRLTVSSSGFVTQVVSGALHEGESFDARTIVLPVANAASEVLVSGGSQAEIAQAQLSFEEKQRVFGVLPNYYVAYDRDAAPLTARQKYQLAWKTEIDPVTWAMTGAVAGFEQAHNTLAGYGQGMQGYGKRFGANYADGFVGTMIGGAILPAWLKQDPRYFYKGTGSFVSRAGYAIANAVICKGDNGRWQPNYSGIIGGLAAGGISNLYYPASDRSGVEVTFANTLIGTAEGALQNLAQEFIVRKLTPRLPVYSSMGTK
jgi:hypothetical protein